MVESWEVRHNNTQPPLKVMDAMGLKPGMVIGEIGAGTGRYCIWLADRVGDKGKVYANDIDKKSLDHLKDRCKKYNIKNITSIMGKVDDPLFPPGSLDITFIINTYHHIEDPVKVIKNAIPALKKGGRLVIVENDATRSGWKSHNTPKEKLIKQAQKAGYKLVRTETFLELDNIYIFEVK